MSSVAVARCYAKALLMVAKEVQQLDEVMQMLEFLGAIISDKQINKLVKSKVMEHEEILRLLLAIAKDKISPTGENLLKILIENNRLLLLPAICDIYTKLCLREKTTLAVVVTLAKSDEAGIAKLKQQLGKYFGQEIMVKCKIEPKIVSGVIVKAGDRVIDGSMQEQLRALHKQLQAE